METSPDNALLFQTHTHLTLTLSTSRLVPVSTWDLASRVRRDFPRKEVIQPHLPVRLPCYDFTPITDPTLDACLSYELAQRLQGLPTFVV